MRIYKYLLKTILFRSKKVRYEKMFFFYGWHWITIEFLGKEKTNLQYSAHTKAKTLIHFICEKMYVTVKKNPNN